MNESDETPNLADIQGFLKGVGIALPKPQVAVLGEDFSWHFIFHFPSTPRNVGWLVYNNFEFEFSAENIVVSIKRWRGKCFKERMRLICDGDMDSEDPALFDTDLEAKLRSNAEIGRKRMAEVSEIIPRYFFLSLNWITLK